MAPKPRAAVAAPSASQLAPVLPEPPPVPVNPGASSTERQAFIDSAAVVIFSRHFHGGKAFQQAAQLWDERKSWLRRESEAGR